MRTIGRKRKLDSPNGDVVVLCSYCGVLWYRSQLVRDAAGNLACPDDSPGLDIVSASLGNAAAASNRQLGRYRQEIDGTFDAKNKVPYPGFVNANGPPPVKPNGGPTGTLSVLTSLWLRSDSLALDSSGLVVRWPDQSSRGNDPLQATASKRPSVGVSGTTGQPYVLFDGLTQFLQATLFGSAPLWIWMVAQQVSWSIGATLYSNGFGLNQNSSSAHLRSVRNSVGTENAGAAVGQWFRSAQNNTVAGTDSLLVGSTLVTDAGAGQRSSSAFSLGSGFNGAGPANVAVSELLVTVGPPTPAEIANIDAYGRATYPGAAF
jgi:hypothetical protein